MVKNRKDPNKPRGRMSAYAYFVQDRRLKAEGQVNFTEFSKDCAERWKKMGTDQKKPYNDKSGADKVRYDREMAHYVPPAKDKKKGGRRSRTPKDPDAPKRNLSAFFLYCRDERAAVKAAHNEWTVGKIAQHLAGVWKDAPADIRAKYDAEAARDKQRYMREMEIFRQTKPKSLQRKQQRKDSSSSSSSDDSSSDDSSSDSDSDEE